MQPVLRVALGSRWRCFVKVPTEVVEFGSQSAPDEDTVYACVRVHVCEGDRLGLVWIQ
jgi:hypothetical protein